MKCRKLIVFISSESSVKNSQNSPSLFLLVKAGKRSFIDALNNGADDYIKKGGDQKSQFDELSHKIKRAVEFRESEQKIARLNRIDAILRRINESVVHIHDRMQLMQEVCKIMVKEAGFVMAWVGFEDPDTHRIESRHRKWDSG